MSSRLITITNITHFSGIARNVSIAGTSNNLSVPAKSSVPIYIYKIKEDKLFLQNLSLFIKNSRVQVFFFDIKLTENDVLNLDGCAAVTLYNSEASALPCNSDQTAIDALSEKVDKVQQKSFVKNFSGNNPSPIFVGRISANLCCISCIVEIIEPFQSTAEISIGVENDHFVFQDKLDNAPTYIGLYKTESYAHFTQATDLYVYLEKNLSQGFGKTVLTFG